MVRFLLNDGNAAFANGKWTFEMDRRLSNAEVFQLRKCSFTATTDLAAPPHCVYVRSDAIHTLSGEKHTQVLKSIQHEDSSNVLAVLEEQHATGRYRLMGPCRPFELVYGHIRNIDVYFTDPAGDNITFFTAAGDSVYNEVVDDMAAPSDTEKTDVVIYRAFDSGGSGANYGNDEALNRSWESLNGKGLILDFQSFASESTYDKLTVRSRDLSTDGWTDIFVDHTGSGVPAGNPFTTGHKIIKFWWTSDSSTNDVGWDAVIYEDWGSDGTLGGDSSAGFTLTVAGGGTTYGASSTDAKFFAEAQIKTT